MNKNFYLLIIWTLIALAPPAMLPASAESPKEKTNICLTMIVKNESRIIERCLNSVKDIADCISICDTGSTDNTVEIIEQFMKKNNIPGKVHRHPWKNFGHNRTLSAQAAMVTLQELKFPTHMTYQLLLDADMILEKKPDFKKEDLKDDSYQVLQKNDSLSYYNTRLIRASLPWTCVGVTHEYWSCGLPAKNEILLTLTIDDHEDGGCKSDKLERDIKLLTEGLKEEPDNSRYMFYLAQTYKCMRNFPEAIKWYKARIDKKGWTEEIYYSKYMIGEIYEDMGFWDQALHWYLDAYQFLPERAEPLKKIATHYRVDGQTNLAYLFAKQGARIPYPAHHCLFISHPVYDYQFDEEISIAAYYTAFKDDGHAAADRLALKKNVPQNIKDQTYRNLVFYAQNLKGATFLPIEIDLPTLNEGSKERYYAINPSILKTGKGYNVICRTINYVNKGGSNYQSRDPLDDTKRTKNFLVQYDPQFKILSQKEVIENFPRNQQPIEPWLNKVKGLEDCRLFTLNGQSWFLCTTIGTHSTLGQSLCKLSDRSEEKTLPVESLLPLKGPNPARYEKNWLPFIKENELYVIYSYDPFIINKVDMKTGNFENVVQYQPKQDLSRFRGSAGPIAFDDGYLLVVHEVVNMDKRIDLHRFVYLDKDFKIQRLSKPFTFRQRGIEFCCGMTTDHSSKNCIVGIGIEDKEAHLVTVSHDTIRGLLEPFQ